MSERPDPPGAGAPPYAGPDGGGLVIGRAARKNPRPTPPCQTMFDILILFGAIALLIALQLYRNMLAFVFPTARVDAVDIARPPEAAADLYAAAHAELQALGFAGPRWYLLRTGNDAADAGQIAAAYVRDEGDVCWLYAMSALDKPNRLNVVFATRLADGRTAVSQAFDPFFEVTATPQRPSRTIGGETYAAQWESHQAWYATLGSAPDPAGATPEGLVAFYRDAYDGARQRLLDDGKAWLDSRGWARPTLRYAWQMLRAVLRRPRPAPSGDPVPPARLAALALIAQRVAERPAPARMQAGLFVVSTALFLVLGAVFWSLELAAILFVVVAIHELGHYLAMRAFGYRDVQMLALPLVGGVTIGHEAKPDAARRAWMSLMGPLPGVVIGWAMLFALRWIDAPPSWWATAATVFLAVNYLNVLPVPPLDGGHVVQALLPARAARLQAVFVVVACIAGAALAYSFGFTLLVVLALMQLPLAQSHWQLARVIGRAHGDAGLDPQRPRTLRLRRLFEIADELFGATPKAQPRIAQATQALQSLDVKPMHWLQRSVIGVVYLVLLAGPVALGAWWWLQSATVSVAALQERAEQAQRESRELAADAAALDFATLVRGIGADGSSAPMQLPPPAGDDAIAAAPARLGIALPDELAMLYRVTDGVPALGLLPLASVMRVGAVPEIGALIDSAANQGSFDVYADERRESNEPELPALHRVDVTTTRDWLVLSAAETGNVIAYDVSSAPAVPGNRLLAFDGAWQAHPGLRRWLESQWVMRQSIRAYTKRYEDGVALRRKVLGPLELPALLDELPQPSLAGRFLMRAPALPAAADADAVAAAERRLGATLPPDLRMLLARHNGVLPLNITAVEEFRRLDLADAAVREVVTTQIAPVDLVHGSSLPSSWPKNVDELASCNVIGRHRLDPTDAQLLWCPTLDESLRFVDLASQKTYATITDYVRDTLARQSAVDHWR